MRKVEARMDIHRSQSNTWGHRHLARAKNIKAKVMLAREKLSIR